MTKTATLLRRSRSCLSTSSISKAVKTINPTWSVSSLQLDKSHEPISREQLNRLGRRALLKVNDEMAPKLQQEVGNMMFLLSQVVEESKKKEKKVDSGNIYDAHIPGTPSAPLCDNGHDKDSKARMERVWNSQLKGKTISVGAHSYFSTRTSAKDEE